MPRSSHFVFFLLSLAAIGCGGPRVVSITQPEAQRGETVRVVVHTKGIDVEPSAYGPRFEIDGLYDVEVSSSGEADSFFVDVNLPDDAAPGVFDVEISARTRQAFLDSTGSTRILKSLLGRSDFFRQTFPASFTILGFDVQFTGNNRTRSHDSDGDGFPDKIAWEFEVESSRPIHVVGELNLRMGHQASLKLPETLIPQGKSLVRFLGTGYGQFGNNPPPEKRVDYVILREAGAPHREAFEIEVREPELRGESFLKDFDWPVLGGNGKVTAREVDDDGDGLLDRIVFSIPFTAESKQPLVDVRMKADISTKDQKFWATAFGSAERLENGANVMEVSLDGEELSAAAVNSPLQLVLVELTAKNFFWRRIPETGGLTTKRYSGASFRKPRPRLVRMFADGEGGREMPIAPAGRKTRIHVICKFAECPEQNPRVSSSSDVTIKEVDAGGDYFWFDAAVAADAPDGWRPVSIQTSAGLLTLPEAFLVQRPEQ